MVEYDAVVKVDKVVVKVDKVPVKVDKVVWQTESRADGTIETRQGDRRAARLTIQASRSS